MFEQSTTLRGFSAEYETIRGTRDTVTYPYATFKKVKKYIKEDLEIFDCPFSEIIVIIRQISTNDVVSIKPRNKNKFTDICYND